MRRKFASNWELSAARAPAAVRLLQEKGGVDPRHLGALGYGEFHPLAPNPTMEGHAHILSRWGENSPKVFSRFEPRNRFVAQRFMVGGKG